MSFDRGRDRGFLTGSVVVLVVLAIMGIRFLMGLREREAPASLIRDSAGLQIVESFRPAWAAGEGWKVGGEPLLRIGVVEGEAAYQFGQLVGGVRLGEGTVVVGDGLSQELRFFGGDGAYRGALGRRGEGPGEFSGLAGVGMAPDGQVWAYDFSLRRITWASATGQMIGLVPLGPEPPVLNMVGALADGSFVLKQLWGAGAVAGATTTGMRRDPVAYVRFDSLGRGLDSVGLFPGREVSLTDVGGRGVMNTPLLARNSVGAVWGERLVVGSMVSFELEELAGSGARVRLLRIPGRDLSLGAGEVEALIRDRIEGTPVERRLGLRESLEAMPVPERRPAYGDLLPDALGNLWVAEWAPYPSIPGTWTVLDAEGRWLGEVAMPPRFLPWQIGPDWVLGVESDELDVERVVVYPLVKSPGG